MTYIMIYIERRENEHKAGGEEEGVNHVSKKERVKKSTWANSEIFSRVKILGGFFHGFLANFHVNGRPALGMAYGLKRLI